MRQISLFLIALFFTLASCKKSEDQSSQQFSPSDITGIWVMKSIIYSGQSSINTDGIEVKTDYRAVSSDVDYTLNFKENNTYSASGGYKLGLTSYTYPYKKEDGTIVSSKFSDQIIEIKEVEIEKSWSLNGAFIDGFVVSDVNNQVTVARITSLEGDQMYLNYKSTVSQTLQGNQGSLLNDIDAEIILERLSTEE